MESSLAYILAISASACFASASLVFADLSRRISPLWMNAFKALVAWACFGLAVVLFGLWTPMEPLVWAALIASGVLGLAIGDIFLLTAYARMGAARTLILFGFQPLFIGVAAHFFFGQDLSWLRLTAVLVFIGCLFIFSLERYRQDGHWEIWGLVAALIAVMFDNSGLLLSRWAFEHADGLTAFQANLLRCSGALGFFVLAGSVRRIHLLRGWRSLTTAVRGLAVASAVFGCFLSLFLYLTAVKIGHLASISALAVAGPIITSALECAYHRKPPSVYLVSALILFLVGFSILNLV